MFFTVFGSVFPKSLICVYVSHMFLCQDVEVLQAGRKIRSSQTSANVFSTTASSSGGGGVDVSAGMLVPVLVKYGNDATSRGQIAKMKLK